MWVLLLALLTWIDVVALDSLLKHIILSFDSQLGFSEDKQVKGAHEYDKAKEKAGFVAGKHINKKSKWWFQSSKKDWVEQGGSGSDNDGK